MFLFEPAVRVVSRLRFASHFLAIGTASGIPDEIAGEAEAWT